MRRTRAPEQRQQAYQRLLPSLGGYLVEGLEVVPKRLGLLLSDVAAGELAALAEEATKAAKKVKAEKQQDEILAGLAGLHPRASLGMEDPRAASAACTAALQASARMHVAPPATSAAAGGAGAAAIRQAVRPRAPAPLASGRLHGHGSCAWRGTDWTQHVVFVVSAGESKITLSAHLTQNSS